MISKVNKVKVVKLDIFIHGIYCVHKNIFSNIWSLQNNFLVLLYKWHLYKHLEKKFDVLIASQNLTSHAEHTSSFGSGSYFGWFYC